MRQILKKGCVMRAIDLKDLINGLITVIVIAISIGQYGKLREFAKKEFIKSMRSTPSAMDQRYAR